jgi:ribosomal protein L37AE/L43A
VASPVDPGPGALRRSMSWQSSKSRQTRSTLGESTADDADMNEQTACPDCGSNALVASGAFGHGTWILRLTCWTCRDCRNVVAIPEEQVKAASEA